MLHGLSFQLVRLLFSHWFIFFLTLIACGAALLLERRPIPLTLFQFLTGRLMPAALQACLRTIRSLNPLFLPRPTPTATNLRSSRSAGGALSWALVDVFSQTGVHQQHRKMQNNIEI